MASNTPITFSVAAGWEIAKRSSGVLAFLAKVYQEHFGLAVLEAWPKNSIYRLYRSLCHQSDIVSWVRQFDQDSIGIFGFLRIEHADAYAHPNFLAL